MSPLILIMIDGVAADYLQRHRANLPNLSALAEEGLLVERLGSDVPATSLPGRTSILTGAPASEHGIHGNTIWDGEMFRYANPDDVRVPTLPRRAMDAGLDVAVIGFGMVRPEDAVVFRGAWWVNEMLQRARDEEPIRADEGWLRTSRHQDASGRLAELAETGLPDDLPDAYAGDRLHYLLSEMTGDRSMLRWSAGLATSDTAPDLLITEILTPDTVQHAAGPEHPFSHWSIGYADALVGTLVEELRRAGRLDQTTLLITSDHGHGLVERALYAERLLPGRTVACEGSILFVAVAGAGEARTVAGLLAEHGVYPLPAEYLPSDRRSQVAAFVAPEGTSFELRPASAIGDQGGAPGSRPGRGMTSETAISGAPKYRSSHGFRPGHPADERFAIVHGPGIARHTSARAEAEDLAPTVAALLGIAHPGPGTSWL